MKPPPKDWPTVDPRVIELLKQNFPVTLDVLSASDDERQRLIGAHELIAFLERVSKGQQR